MLMSYQSLKKNLAQKNLTTDLLVICLTYQTKNFERLMFNQLSNYFRDILSKFQCGFRTGNSAQDCFVAMIEKWKIFIDNGDSCGALLAGLSKAFDCLPP